MKKKSEHAHIHQTGYCWRNPTHGSYCSKCGPCPKCRPMKGGPSITLTLKFPKGADETHVADYAEFLNRMALSTVCREFQGDCRPVISYEIDGGE